MKTKTLLLKGLFTLLLLIWTSLKSVHAQCLPDGITFSSQTQIDSFQINYPGCSQILGDVKIEESSNGNIINLNGLLPLTSFEGDIQMWKNSALISLSGLDNVTAIGGDLSLFNNHNLETLSSLGNVTVIGGDLSVFGTDFLTNLSGLENVVDIGGNMIVRENSALATLNGLDSLVSIGGELWLRYNTVLTSMNGLGNLSSIGGDLSLEDNDAMTSLSGLENLSSINGNLGIRFNDTLINLTSLEALTSINGNLDVRVNGVLTSLSGLDNIDYSTITELSIITCTNLSICAVKSVCDYLENNGLATVSGNALGCNSEPEIEAGCLVPVEEILFDELSIIQVFPNPTNDIIQIKGINPEGWKFSIMNTSGMIVKSHQLTENGLIDLSYLSNGLYFLELKNKDQIVVKKVIKE
jgi:hypothetical protein